MSVAAPASEPTLPKVIVTGDAEENDTQRRRAEEETAAQNQEVKAHNETQRCNFARKKLGVAKEARAMFRRDDKGDRQYVKDESRPAEISAAQQKAAGDGNWFAQPTLPRYLQIRTEICTI